MMSDRPLLMNIQPRGEVMSHVDHSIAPEPYYVMRAALALFQMTPAELSDNQLHKAKLQADSEYRIENRVLKSKEAAEAVVSEQTLADALHQISDRFDSEENFLSTLDQNGLNPQSLQSAILRQCKVESIMEMVATRAAKVTDAEVDIYYHMHPERFHRPEQRSVAHILITINDEFDENTRPNAEHRIREIRLKLFQKPHLFAELAMKNSECPSALQGGELGRFERSKLYPEIEHVLFNLKEGQLSDIVETEAGFHLVKCLKIHYAETLSLKKTRPKIRKMMQDRLQRTCQRAWLAALPE
jgi:peptidyl-prolyl cis-trans isomerase C